MSINPEEYNLHPNVYKRLAEAKKNSDPTNDALLRDLKKGSRPVYFWDRIIDGLNRKKHIRFIIQRVIQRSFPKDFDDNMEMLEKYYTKNEILEVCLNPYERIDTCQLERITARYNIKPIPSGTAASRRGKILDINILFDNKKEYASC